ncbi:MAG: phosphatidate cytidylyltransferase [Propionibacteriaceae bacterium]|jgi:phosphatidate cytidylyltransferase|nr:phosphatidate cytidylyltransferase [Propionibacteriaceae bacterium]
MAKSNKDDTTESRRSKGSSAELQAVEHAFNEFADAAKHAVDEVNKRAGRDIFLAVFAAFVLLGVAAVCLIWLPWALVLVVTVAVCGAQIEMGKIFETRGVKILSIPLLTGSALFTLAVYASALYPIIPVEVLLWIAGLTVVVVLVVRLSGPIDGYLADVAHSLFLFCYPCLLAAGMVLMLAEDQGVAFVASFLLIITAADTGGYVMGLAIGKHPIAPRISPKKSWEGLVGSLILASAAGLIMTIFLIGSSWWKGIIVGIVLAIVGFLGDLVESVIKRDLGIKDMGTLIPGHGGIMDRVDSYILTALPAWLIMIWLFPSV